jgi:hypothetical protein
MTAPALNPPSRPPEAARVTLDAAASALRRSRDATKRLIAIGVLEGGTADGRWWVSVESLVRALAER